MVEGFRAQSQQVQDGVMFVPPHQYKTCYPPHQQHCPSNHFYNQGLGSNLQLLALLAYPSIEHSTKINLGPLCLKTYKQIFHRPQKASTLNQQLLLNNVL